MLTIATSSRSGSVSWIKKLIKNRKIQNSGQVVAFFSIYYFIILTSTGLSEDEVHVNEEISLMHGMHLGLK